MSSSPDPAASGEVAESADDVIEPAAPADTSTPPGDEAVNEVADGSDPPAPDDEREEEFVDGTVGRSELATERDDYLEALQRVKAEFDNYRKRTEKERMAMIDRASETIVTELLPVLDACDAAIAHGDEGVAQIRSKLIEVLGKSGLEPIESMDKPFDPNMHEAVLREEAEGEPDTVAEIMRAGYTWRGRVVRPAMVKVRL